MFCRVSAKGFCLSMGVSVGLSIFLGAVSTCQLKAQHPKLKIVAGHVSPVQAETTFRNGEKSAAWVVGVGSRGPGGSMVTHQLSALDPEGQRVTLWLDTIQEIRVVERGRVEVRTKDGSTHKLNHRARALKVHRKDGGSGAINLDDVAVIRFVKAPRTDSAGHTMLDEWKYSPYTGEELEEIESTDT